jgi:tRNA-uridine 2-sulfurtransferase
VKVLLAMSGGVDSSVAGVLLQERGHDVVGVTMKLWGGDSDTGCCSVSDVDDARRVAQQLGIDHLVFNFGDDFERHVVSPYVRAHADGVTPNPCVECNRHLKFDRLLRRAEQLGFDAVATGHHARVGRTPDGRFVLERGADSAKDQSYVVHMLDHAALSRTLFPVGDMDKSRVRELAVARGLRTASKPDSQDVCFITSRGGRETFLGNRIAFRPGQVVDIGGAEVGEVAALEMVTIGQRRGIGLPGGGPKRYVVDVDMSAALVTVGDEGDLLRSSMRVEHVAWTDGPQRGPVRVQCSAHGATATATIELSGDTRTVEVTWDDPERRVAPGQSVVFYDAADRVVLGGGIAAR